MGFRALCLFIVVPWVSLLFVSVAFFDSYDITVIKWITPCHK